MKNAFGSIIGYAEMKQKMVRILDQPANPEKSELLKVGKG